MTDDYNPKQLYTWYRNKETEEWHLFKTKIETRGVTEQKVCKPEEKESVCSFVNISEADKVYSVKCVNEDKARMQAAEFLKRQACGVCVSTLYGSIY